MNPYPDINHWIIPDGLFRASLDELARDGKKGKEGMCLWLGSRGHDRNARFTHAGFFEPNSIKNGPAHIQIEPELMLDLHKKAEANGITLIGQIHSHPKIAGVNLSYTDRTYGISVPGYLSLVVPNFAMGKHVSIENCGVHMFVRGRGYRQLTKNEVAQKIVVDPKLGFSILKIGNGKRRFIKPGI